MVQTEKNMGTVLVEIVNEKDYRLLEDLAALNIIRLHTSIPTQTKLSTGTPEFGFARNMIHSVSDNFNEPLREFSDYMP